MLASGSRLYLLLKSRLAGPSAAAVNFRLVGRPAGLGPGLGLVLV